MTCPLDTKDQKAPSTLRDVAPQKVERPLAERLGSAASLAFDLRLNPTETALSPRSSLAAPEECERCPIRTKRRLGFSGGRAVYRSVACRTAIDKLPMVSYSLGRLGGNSIKTAPSGRRQLRHTRAY
jgi:hypothetical protein